jgi:hypothetical protein
MWDEGLEIKEELLFWDTTMSNICQKLDIVVNVVQFLDMVLAFVQYFE